jgi:hypothetical protein
VAAVRYLYKLGLALWLGSLFFFAAAVAPALFKVFEPPQAGSVVRQLIPFLDTYGVLGAVGLIGLAAVVEGRPRGRALLRAALLAGMGALAAASLFGVTPRMERLRISAGPSLSALPPDDPVRRQFGMLHGVSTVLMLGEALLGLGVLGLDLRGRPAS